METFRIKYPNKKLITFKKRKNKISNYKLTN